MRADGSAIVVEPLRKQDRERWETLARGYHTFYERILPDEVFSDTWNQLMAATQIFGLGARINGELAGITHFLFHPRIGFSDACYLQDLFVEERSRGTGIGRALIDAVAERAKMRGCSRLYWHTRENNLPARALYETLATFDGFIRYDRHL